MADNIIDLEKWRAASLAPAARDALKIVTAASEHGKFGPCEADALCRAVQAVLTNDEWDFQWWIEG